MDIRQTGCTAHTLSVPEVRKTVIILFVISLGTHLMILFEGKLTYLKGGGDVGGRRGGG